MVSVKKSLTTILLSLSIVLIFHYTGNAQSLPQDFFDSTAIRLDFILAGDSNHTNAFLHEITVEDQWHGSYSNFKEPYSPGNFLFQIWDEEGENLFFESSFNTLFGEWQTTNEAKSLTRSFEQSVYFPSPREKFFFKLYKREGRETSNLLMNTVIDPGNFLLPRYDKALDYEIIEQNGEPSERVDFVFVGDGYTNRDKAKFMSDVKRFTDYLFSIRPYSEHRHLINVHAVLPPDSERGPDNPDKGEWKNTPAGTSFYTFGSERYLTTTNYWNLCDLVRNIPHDHILVMVNSEKYGGGGIYNHYSIFSSDHELSEIVFVHELGHGFAGLGDEYYDSSVAYEDFYPLDEEPLVPNLTTLIDFEIKWDSLVDKSIPIPTPEIPDYNNITGAFEGGGYVAKGIFRPQINCRMKSNEAKEFCSVCRQSITRMINHYANDTN